MKVTSVNLGELPNGRIGINIRISENDEPFARILTTAEDNDEAIEIVKQSHVDPSSIRGFKKLSNG